MSVVTATVAEVEVSAKAQRRRFTAEYKHRILQEADACTKSGQVGALLRREGLYSSHLNDWRALRKRAELAGLAAKKRGPKARQVDERDLRIVELERQLARAEAKAERAELIIEVQKKVGRLLGVEMPEDPLSTVKR